MSDEAKINVATGFSGGVSVSLRADSAQELDALVASVAASASAALFSEVTRVVTFSAPNVDQQAIANVQQAFPQAQVIQGVPNNVVQMPTQPQAQAGPPPGANYPGDCAHGPRVYKSSLARGKQWNRYECAIPWSQGVQGRCQAVNV